MSLFQQFNSSANEIPAQNVPYIGGRAAVLRGNILMVEDGVEQIAMEIAQDDAAAFARAVKDYDPYNDAATAQAAISAAEDIQWRALRWQRNGSKAVHDGPPIKVDRFGETRWLPAR